MERRLKAFKVTGQMREECPEAIACACNGFTVMDVVHDKIRDIYTYILYSKDFTVWPEGAEIYSDIDILITRDDKGVITDIRRTIR